MNRKHGDSTQIRGCLVMLHRGLPEAREELYRWSRRRLSQLASRMLKDYPLVAGELQTDDLVQNAIIRLERALEQCHPSSVREFIGLATLQIRRELMTIANRARRRARILRVVRTADCLQDSSIGGMEISDSTYGF